MKYFDDSTQKMHYEISQDPERHYWKMRVRFRDSIKKSQQNMNRAVTALQVSSYLGLCLVPYASYSQTYQWYYWVCITSMFVGGMIYRATKKEPSILPQFFVSDKDVVKMWILKIKDMRVPPVDSISTEILNTLKEEADALIKYKKL